MIGAHDAISTGERFAGVGVDRLIDDADANGDVGAIGDAAPIEVDAEGRSEGVFADRHLVFDGMNTIIGRSIVISNVDGSEREGEMRPEQFKNLHDSV